MVEPTAKTYAEDLFQKRFILFSNNAAAGIFKVKKTHLYVILSQNCEFVHLSIGDSTQVHLTRYVSSEHAQRVRELLNFRNRFVQKPYLCSRFHDTEDYYGDEYISLRRSASGNYQCDAQHNLVSRGVYEHAVCVGLTFVCKEENVAGRSSAHSPRRFLTLSQQLPIHWPSATQYRELLDKHAETDVVIVIPVPEAELCGARESAEALELFHSIAPEMTLFLNLDYYSKSLSIVAESIDDMTLYLRTLHTHESQVECWVLTSPLSEVPTTTALGVSAVLSLHRETIRMDWTAQDGSAQSYSAHLSLLDIDAIFPDEELETDSEITR